MMSAFHPMATEQRTQFYVGFVPKAHIRLSFDYLVGAGEERWWYREAEYPCGLSIDDKLKLARLHNRHIYRLRAF